jgi:hypothetical protein
MAIDYSQRPSGMSKREWWAEQTGNDKYEYPGSSDKEENSSSSSYKPKTYDYKDLVDTSGLEKSYSEAKSVYTEQLASLKPRYEELYKQLQAEKELAGEKAEAMSAEEIAQQKRDIAKRGVAATDDNQFYTTEKGKLEKEQDLRDREMELDFAGSRLDISQAESADTRDFTTAIANLDLSKANTITDLISSAKQTAAQLNSSEADRALQSSIWEKQFAYTKSKDEADRALDLYKLSKNESLVKDTNYNNAKASLITNAYTTTIKDDYSKPGIRENIVKQLQIAFPDIPADKIEADVGSQMPNGWESSAFASPVVKKDAEGNSFIEW